jgi:DNA-directed RNA polymerase specialized sigma24 family protein
MAKADRTEALLALILLQHMKSSSQQEIIVQLSVAGFSNLEIADMLQTTTGVVAQSLYSARKGKSPKKQKKRAKKSSSD